ncbi:hypothetical protein TBK1r_77970 [Stieleria magnilauensis]|uniref:Uncharacterized protein n=1 Tax=Stieleria magnilauensis TaxID=2527963 RepID=A0ABX5Y398_9BACT|nr:hypothetical protein TBK1r_77970 [Planctomycetes bacterium TBK1r]
MGVSVGVQALAAYGRCVAATGNRLKAKHQRLLNPLRLQPMPFGDLTLFRGSLNLSVALDGADDDPCALFGDHFHTRAVVHEIAFGDDIDAVIVDHHFSART